MYNSTLKRSTAFSFCNTCTIFAQARGADASNCSAGYESCARGCHRAHQTPELEDEECDQVGGLEGVVLEHLSPHSLYGGEGDEKGGTVPAFDFRQHEQSKKEDM